MQQPLIEYQRKRNFRYTPEPKALRVTRQQKQLIFVVQEHHARRLHYDFRLEFEGVLKSWAVPKGVSLDKKIKRLAVQTEDHPYEYAKFSGTIPKGHYGAGEVYIWDQGTWRPIGDAKKGLKEGRLEFDLKGRKLNGRFLLVRTNAKGKAKQWLIMKRDDAEFIKPQLATLTEHPPTGKNWVHEVKFDGYRTQAHVMGGEVKLFTRNGNDWTIVYPSVTKALKKLKVESAVLDGEIVWADEKGKHNFQALQNSLTAGSDQSNLIFYIFDLLNLNGEDLRHLSLLERKERLKKIISRYRRPLAFSEHFLTSGENFFAKACKGNLEGIVSKQLDAPYISGRGSQWLKTKCKSREEFVIGGYSKGRGSRGELGALLVGIYENGLFRYVGRVGTGFTVKTLNEILKKLKTLEVKKTPFDINIPRGKDLHWVKPKLVAEVSYANWTDEKILRAPVFHGLRSDKPAAEVQVTHPERVIYKKEGITKEQVAMYYQVVAPYMLPYIAGRPLSLVRCPENSTAKCFFQKHLPNDKNEISISAADDLLGLVQFGALEFHASNATKASRDHANQIVMDFDPGPGVKWSAVIEAATALRKILDDAGLQSFVKTTGGKGLHVHIPLSPARNFAQVKELSLQLAQKVAATAPNKYVVVMAKSKRRNKIFVDYLRNTKKATAVAPYSLRSRPLSSVAMPVEWSELKKLRSGDQFTMAEAIAHLAARPRDPWEDYGVI